MNHCFVNQILHRCKFSAQKSSSHPLEDAFLHAQEPSERAVSGTSPLGQARQEAVEALTALGYSASEALRAVKAVEQEDMDVEDLLKAALKKMYG